MGSLLGSKPKQPKPIPAQKVIPVQDTTVTDNARKKAAAQLQQRGGVASTVLSDSLGG